MSTRYALHIHGEITSHEAEFYYLHVVYSKEHVAKDKVRLD